VKSRFCVWFFCVFLCNLFENPHFVANFLFVFV
jgi:hypothetical protein